MNTFPGFPPATIEFLADLTLNNHREWFTAHKKQFEQVVQNPALDFIAAMGPVFERIAPHYEAIPKKVGGSLLRIYRDTRFSKDKTPYKTNVGIHMQHRDHRDIHAPGYYLHLAPDGCFLGVGIWHPEAEPLAQIRAAIAEQPQAWIAARDALTGSGWQMEGDSLKRPPKGFAADHPLIEDLKRKDFLGLYPLRFEEVTQPDFVAQVETRYAQGDSLMRFLCAALELRF
ncbi:MAG: TIGR02453 family protein [Alphaproteobacteria bacterium CG_4_10_14_0_2_um_filter_63_37]|nr:MAG: TIGR02453 family protein [Proteobacteria bacterium CG1_02_64_396]PJA24094.1 MAG: TIGR02453 family protein [Alphaproteobacteria bacterium CG_4_10_14_0_2_um_filter_63_37]